MEAAQRPVMILYLLLESDSTNFSVGDKRAHLLCSSRTLRCWNSDEYISLSNLVDANSAFTAVVNAGGMMAVAVLIDHGNLNSFG
ncbi:hypothetical protein OGAPHI_007160 [Ogataea philodendri]|uniref:Uncharacterized protein n=1 Tax=Ogataea philodendri TaxID=1378263 RepID=A0A9P8SZX7_9ASCO|nr:uncharacterized protein OGAPHI_007160 [Ogataea philodendri]KAH3660574.1 hypothetical protein OGAPHI_007160 [Ogataea philodendri]